MIALVARVGIHITFTKLHIIKIRKKLSFKYLMHRDGNRFK